MKSPAHTPARTLIALALAAAYPLSAAAESDVDRLVKPDNSLSVGIDSVGADNQRFGMYNGLSKDERHFVGEASIVKRYDSDGKTLRIDLRNLGVPSAEFRIQHEKPGAWSYYLDYNQTTRVTPYDVYTGLNGIGTNSQSRPAAANALLPRSTAGETEIKVERAKYTFGQNTTITPELEMQLKFQSEDKKGNRLFGRGTGTVQEFLAEPIDSTTRQVDLTLHYTGSRLQLSGGYYGSFYNNRNPGLSITGGATALNTAPTSVFSPIALPPDNLAHQYHVSAAYNFGKTTRATFKYSHTRNTQNDAFILPISRQTPAAPSATAQTGNNDSGRSDLGGRVDTTLAQLGLTSRPIAGLSLLGNLRYEDIADKTIITKYIQPLTANTPAARATATTDGFNEPRSLKNVSGKIEASYQLPDGYRLTGGLDLEKKTRTMAGVRIVGYREHTQETTYRIELKRSLFDSLSGSLALLHAKRDGSDFRTLNTLGGCLYGNGTTAAATTCATGATAGIVGLLQPIYIADRNRDKLRLALDWSPLENLSVQFTAEGSNDDYGRRGLTPDIGMRSGDARLFSFDASYAINDKWQLTGYASQFTTKIDQSTGLTAAAVWNAALKNIGQNYSLGVKGKLTGQIDLGAELLWAKDLSEYALSGAGVSSLPDIDNKQATFKLFARYAWDRDSGVRMDYLHDKRRSTDWTWNGASNNPYVYTDGTWLYQNPNEKVHFVGVSLYYNFR